MLLEMRQKGWRITESMMTKGVRYTMLQMKGSIYAYSHCYGEDRTCQLNYSAREVYMWAPLLIHCVWKSWKSAWGLAD